MTTGVYIATYPLGRTGPAMTTTYRPDIVVSIDDQQPWVLIGFDDPGEAKVTLVDGGPQQYIVRHELTVHGRPPAPGIHWWACCPFAAGRNVIGADRRYGDFAVLIEVPVVVRLTCVVWPGKFFGPVDYHRMLGEIRAEFGWSIEWDDANDLVRSRIEEVPGPSRFAEDLDDIAQELRACHHWLAHRRADDEFEAECAPEDRLVAAWARRRASTLAAMSAQLRRFLDELAGVTGGARRVARAQREGFARLLDRAQILSSQVEWVAQQQHSNLGPFTLSPAMQRDHRLRKMVQAFAQTSEERWAYLVTPDLSSAPPLKATHVFELWCVARLVTALVALGWNVSTRSVRQSHPDGGAPVHSRVELIHGDAMLVLEFQPAILPLDSAGMAELHQRGRAGIDELAAAAGPDGLVSYGEETPDLVLMLRRADGRRAFAIGDAAMSDPQRGGAADKIEKMIVYRDRIAWRVDGRVVRCAVTGTFVLLPGPPDRWERALRGRPNDSVVMFPSPRAQPDVDLLARTQALLELLDHAAH